MIYRRLLGAAIARRLSATPARAGARGDAGSRAETPERVDDGGDEQAPYALPGGRTRARRERRAVVLALTVAVRAHDTVRVCKAKEPRAVAFS
jgi:hypothetical protein